MPPSFSIDKHSYSNCCLSISLVWYLPWDLGYFNPGEDLSFISLLLNTRPLGGLLHVFLKSRWLCLSVDSCRSCIYSFALSRENCLASFLPRSGKKIIIWSRFSFGTSIFLTVLSNGFIWTRFAWKIGVLGFIICDWEFDHNLSNYVFCLSKWSFIALARLKEVLSSSIPKL